jgi:hypothetical protein
MTIIGGVLDVEAASAALVVAELAVMEEVNASEVNKGLGTAGKTGSDSAGAAGGDENCTEAPWGIVWAGSGSSAASSFSGGTSSGICTSGSFISTKTHIPKEGQSIALVLNILGIEYAPSIRAAGFISTPRGTETDEATFISWETGSVLLQEPKKTAPVSPKISTKEKKHVIFMEHLPKVHRSPFL